MEYAKLCDSDYRFMCVVWDDATKTDVPFSTSGIWKTPDAVCYKIVHP